MKKWPLLLCCLALSLASCAGISNTPKDLASAQANEVFLPEDRPEFVKSADVKVYELRKPWNYDKEWNAKRYYPLIVSLHGGSASTEGYYVPCLNSVEDMQKYPCFFMTPNNIGGSGWGPDAAGVRDQIEELIATYRIDTNRLYLIGFSGGGSGSYPFANSYYEEHGRIFAGIVRLAGQSQTTLRDEIAGRTSVWYHVGLNDAPVRVTIAEEAYQNMKAFPGNAGAVEAVTSDEVDGHPRSTKALTTEGIVIMRKSEYAGMGHDGDIPFHDPEVMKWLFSQSLEQRK